MMICKKCGAQIDDSVAFCPVCGAPQTKVQSQQVPEATPIALTQPIAPTQQQTAPHPAQPQENPFEKKTVQDNPFEMGGSQPQQDPFQGSAEDPFRSEVPRPGQVQYGDGQGQYQQNQYQQNQYQYQQNPYQRQVVDNGGFGWGLLGCCIPLVGLILFLVWKNDKPNSAKAAGIGALVGVGLSVLSSIISVLLGVGAGMAGY